MKAKIKKKISQSISKFLSRTPKHISENIWFYHESKGIKIIHEIRLSDGTYIRTDQFIISWQNIFEAIKDFKRAKVMMKRLRCIGVKRSLNKTEL